MSVREIIENVQDLLSVGEVPAIYWRNSGIKNEVLQAKEILKEKMFQVRSMKAGLPELLSEIISVEQALARIEAAERGMRFSAEETATLESVVQQAHRVVGVREIEEKVQSFSQMLYFIRGLDQLYIPVDEVGREVTSYMAKYAKEAADRKKAKRNRQIIGGGLGVIAFVLFIAFIVLPILARAAGPLGFETIIRETEIVEKLVVETQIVEVTPIPEPTSPPVSAFASVYIPLDNIVPQVPQEVVGMYVIDDAYTTWEGPWNVDLNSGVGGSHIYLNYSILGPSLLNDPYVMWNMDIPLPSDGYYEIFVVDPATQGAMYGSDQIFFEVFSDGIVVPPLLGEDAIVQVPDVVQDYQDEWVGIGIYKLNAGATISVKGMPPEVGNNTASVFGADAVLIAKLPDPVVQNEVASSQPGFLEADKDMLFVLDDSAAVRSPAEGWFATEENLNRWGTSVAFPMTSGSEQPYVNYIGDHQLLAGYYELWAWVDVDLTVPVKYTVRLIKDNGANIARSAFTEYQSNTDEPGGLTMDPGRGNVVGKAVLLGTISIDEPVTLDVLVRPQSGSVGNFVLDALVVLVAPEPETGD